MGQLATESIGFGPGGFGMPAVDGNTKRSYCYDIEHRNGMCIYEAQINDIDGISVELGIVCPCATGARISSVTGGVIIGFDMYGQYITETVGAAGTSVVCFKSVVSAPADALWTNTFGLPYRYSADDGVPANVTYIAPSGFNGRGAFTYGGAADAAVLQYTADQDNLFGDVRPLLPATPAALDSVGFVATLSLAGVLTITAIEVADGSDTVTYVLPDGQVHIEDNAAATLVYNFSPLYITQYLRTEIGDENFLKLVRAATSHGTHIIVGGTP